MQKMKYRVRFLTPAFLGNAEQNGQWRTPPFKALLRQWWRVVRAQGAGYDHRKLRESEGRLFGHAWLDDGHGKTWASRSKVRLRLDSWKNGDLRSWNGLEQETVTHPEVQRTGFKVGPHAYLGYGPLDGRGGTKLRKLNGKPNAAIQAGETSTLSIAAPESEIDALRTALALMNACGTVGGRLARSGNENETKEEAGEERTQQLQKMSTHTHVHCVKHGISGRNRVWLKFTASEDKPPALTAIFSPSFPRKRESRDFRD